MSKRLKKRGNGKRKCVNDRSSLLSPRRRTIHDGQEQEDRGSKDAPNDVLMLHLLQQTDLANGGTRHALILRLETDLLERDNLSRFAVAGAVLRGEKGDPGLKVRGRRGKKGYRQLGRVEERGGQTYDDTVGSYSFIRGPTSAGKGGERRETVSEPVRPAPQKRLERSHLAESALVQAAPLHPARLTAARVVGGGK